MALCFCFQKRFYESDFEEDLSVAYRALSSTSASVTDIDFKGRKSSACFKQAIVAVKDNPRLSSEHRTKWVTLDGRAHRNNNKKALKGPYSVAENWCETWTEALASDISN